MKSISNNLLTIKRELEIKKKIISVIEECGTMEIRDYILF